MLRLAASSVLLLAALCWGSGNVANKTVLDHLGPLTVVGIRCLVAAALVLPLALRGASGHPNGAWIVSALRCAALFALGLLFQQIAFQSTSVTNASFLVNTTTVLTPLLAWVLLRQPPGLCMILAGPLALAGAALMAGFGLSMHGIRAGDAYCLVSALAYSGWMLALGDHACRFGHPLATALVQFLCAGAVILPLGLLAEAPNIAGLRLALPDLLYLSIISTALPFAMMSWAQRHVPAATAAILTSAEGPFGALAAFLILGEITPALGFLGAALILFAGLWVVLDGNRSEARALPAIEPLTPQMTGKPAPHFTDPI